MPGSDVRVQRVCRGEGLLFEGGARWPQVPANCPPFSVFWDSSRESETQGGQLPR
jgi:hypothetical protein